MIPPKPSETLDLVLIGVIASGHDASARWERGKLVSVRSAAPARGIRVWSCWHLEGSQIQTTEETDASDM